MLLVDNHTGSYVNCLHNGVPVFPFKREFEDDRELLKLGDYLTWLHGTSSQLALKNAEYFKLHLGLRTTDQATAFADIFKL